jgi:hypothetical protein
MRSQFLQDEMDFEVLIEILLNEQRDQDFFQIGFNGTSHISFNNRDFTRFYILNNNIIWYNT